MSHRSVLGIDLASKKWQDIGTCHISQTATLEIETPAIRFPKMELTPYALADCLLDFINSNHTSIVSIDGPHGWRDPDADAARPGVGRLCEYLAKCQGKTGVLGTTFPRTQLKWTQFSIELFSILVSSGGRLANDSTLSKLPQLPTGEFWVLECFPTHVWKSNGLTALPSKSKIGKDRAKLAAFADALRSKFGLAAFLSTDFSHDDLQSVVAALPAVALAGWTSELIPAAMGLPCQIAATNNGEPETRLEGLIWSCTQNEVCDAK